MKHEFKVTKSKDQTVYTLESATSGGTSSGGVASVSTALGGVRKRGDNLLAQEADKNKVPATAPRNFVAKNAKTSGAGAHADKKKAAKQGDTKHKNKSFDMAEGEKKGLYYYVNKRKKAGTSRDASSPKAPTAQAWKDAAKTAKKEGVAEDHEIQMASSELQAIAKNAVRLLDLVRKYSEAEGLEAWQQSKITKAADYLTSVLQSISGEQSNLEDHSNFGNGWGQNSYDTYAGGNHGRGVAEGSSDFVGDAIEALRSSKPGLEQEDFLDELYMYIENQYGQRAAEMMSNAGQDDFDEWYDNYTDMAETAPKGWEGTVKAMKKHDEIDNPWALAHYMKGKGYKSHKEDAYMAELAAKIAEKLDPNADVDVWIQDFQKADPNKYRQFKNKTPEKKEQMATSARYAAKNPSKK